jgi:hypothetical protein
MNEQAVARIGGSDVSWSGWSTAPDRADAPRPDAVRLEAAQATLPLPGAHHEADAPAEHDGSIDPIAGSQAHARDAAFPTSYARFAINPETQRLSIKIVDAVTNEVIREIPPEQVERIAEDLQTLARHGSSSRRSAGGLGAAGSTGGGVDRYV